MREESDAIVIKREPPGNPWSKLGNNAKMAKAQNGKFLGKALEPSFGKIKVGRNEPCPCGSGKKYKKCCGG
jgi:uncharacterized protein YecA (UPF0149 family)